MSGTTQKGRGIPVTWDYTWWQARYAHLAEWTGPGVAQGYFELAQGYLDNGPRSPVVDTERRQVLFGLLVAHMAKLLSPINGEPASPLVGRITNATEGSVSVGVDMPTAPGAEWYNQTAYGAMFWAMTARFRMARYHVGPQPFREEPQLGYGGPLRGGNGFPQGW